MTYRGTVKNGVVVFLQPAPLADGVEVEVAVVDDDHQGVDEQKTLRERLKNVIGKAKDHPPDASVNIDHYLYGMPKK